MRARRLTAAVAGVVAAGGLILAAGSAEAHQSLNWSSIDAQPDARGIAAPDALSPQLRQYIAAQGSMKLENPDGLVGFYGYNTDGTLVPDPAVVQSEDHNVEASKTEPDKNTYLRLPGLHGADPHYYYGTHFLYQGHEGGRAGYISRINLDADAAHRVTLLADKLTDGTPIPTIDGSTWDPWAKRLLFTTESGDNASVMQSTPDIHAVVQDISSVLGRGGYEGIQNDSAGNLWIVEDVSDTTVPTKTKIPNSFVYRFVPYDKSDLTRGGKLQALQVLSNRSHQPITFQDVDAGHPTGGAFTDDQKDLSSFGKTFDTRWVTLHDTRVDTSGKPFDANAAAKKGGATPFKRPENGVFRPGTGFRDFYFTATGDTDITSSANESFGGWGGLYHLNQSNPNSNTGKLSLFYSSDKTHTGLDNITFVDDDHVAVVQDAGGVHGQVGLFDSGYLFDTRADYAHGRQPIRFLAAGRDAAATTDSLLAPLGHGFQNEDDNEITGIHASDGDPGTGGILGAKEPRLFEDGWRLFWTQQHGDNVTWEITSN
jgi:hypothetical protein